MHDRSPYRGIFLGANVLYLVFPTGYMALFKTKPTVCNLSNVPDVVAQDAEINFTVVLVQWTCI